MHNTMHYDLRQPFKLSKQLADGKVNVQFDFSFFSQYIHEQIV